MRPSAVHPTGVERTFGEEEIIVTKTDLKGIILYANDVFLRVSALTETDALGSPHSIIRHPEMPRCVFSLLWETIESGQEIFAYVLDMAVDGAHYWVFAHVTPTMGPDGSIVGYHSNRRTPDRHVLAGVQQLYATLLAEEQRQGSTKTAIEAGRALLAQVLADRGSTYEEFVWELANSAKAGASR